MRKFITPVKFLILVLVLIGFNLLALDLKILGANKPTGQSNPQAVADPNVCPNCEERLNDLEAKFNQFAKTQNISPTPSPTPLPLNYYSLQTTPAPKPSEYYIPFGSGSGNYTDWTDVPGLQAYIDNTAYGKIKSVVFEASLHIPTGNEIASVRLVNDTDGRVIANSELDFNGNTDSVFLSSQPLNLDYGQKLYKVQMKTQLAYPAVLDQSRIHIISF